ncbi:ABC transporter permease subunit [Parasphingorhabdus sp. DH2-15]|uniref:ABC transporter permease subunit n=1 Tax=Parasphingorhabdus sp. DH2-15 TaxID=3444112 RepID=UPI003F684852
MFANIAAFEFRYQLKNPVFWVVAILFFLLTFASVTWDNVQIGSGGNVNVNSPLAILRVHSILTIFYMFVTTAFVANVVLRDSESGFGPMVLSTRVSKFDYLIGRFTGAFAIACVAFLFVPLAIFIGSFAPWLDPETLGPNKLSYYAFAYFVIAIPGIFLTSAIFFAVATITRSMMYSYIAVVIFMVLYLTIIGVLSSKAELRYLTAYVDPFGSGALANVTRYWTAAESNTQLPPFSGELLYNRVLWTAIGLGALFFAFARFSFAQKGASKRQMRREAKKAQKLSATPPQIASILPATNVRSAAMSQLWAQMRLEMRMVMRSPAFFVLIFIGLINTLAGLAFGAEAYGAPAHPRTFLYISIMLGTFTLFPIIISIYYAGELVWRDRDRKMHEIIDATPLPNWGYMVPKTIGVSLVLFFALLMGSLAGILIQLIRGPEAINVVQHLTWYVLPNGIDMIILAVLAVFIQALSPNKYIGWALMVLYIVASIIFTAIGLGHPLVLYGNGAPTPAFSDINGDNINTALGWWLRLYWGAFAVLLAIGAHLLWRRGTEHSLMPRIRQIPRRLISGAGILALGATGVAAATGANIYYNTNVLNDYRTPDDIEKALAEYEKKYLKYESVLQPSVTDIAINADLYPYQKRAEFTGTYQLINDTGASVEQLHVRLPDPNIEVIDLKVLGAKRTLDDGEYKYYIFTFDTPLAPNAKASLSFTTRREQKGLPALGDDTRLVRNGTFLNNSEFAPQIGMDRNGLLQDRATRRSYDLEPELRLAKLEDESARNRNYVGNADWVSSDITITTRADQIAIAPGSKVSDTVSGDRRTARFTSTSPILAFFSIQSADFEVKSRSVDGVELSVYYHDSHDYNVERMLKAAEASLAYYKTNYGPYQFDHARIIEFPGYASFAQAFAGTMPYSEAIGFIANMDDSDDIDFVTYVVAHEIAHQYWAHQLISADQQGGTILVETMAQYSALMVMKELYGEDKIRRFLKFELDRYLNSRGAEVIEELPLYRVENQPYIHYRKGAVAMYLLQDRLGEKRMNAVFADLLDRYRFKSQPYASSLDLVNGLKTLARNPGEEALIVDLLEKITIYDLKAEDASTKKTGDKTWTTTFTVKADKFYADGLGKETKAKLSDIIDVGAFTERPGNEVFAKANVLSMARQQIRSGEQKITIVTDKKPSFVGIDPYNKYIDRNSDDNVTDVEDETGA